MDQNEKDKRIRSASGIAGIKYLTAAVFLFFVFGMFALNLIETVSNAGEQKSVRSMFRDMETVDSATYPFVNINGLYQNIMQRDYIYDADPANDTIRTSHDQLVSVSSAVSKDKLAGSAEALSRSSEWLEGMGIPLIYIQAPSKAAFSPEEVMPGIRNTTYEKTVSFLEMIDEESIEHIDAREWMDETKETGFYATDHHWKTETCLDIAVRLGEYLNENHGFDIDKGVLDTDNYEFDTLNDAFLGAEGRRTGRYYIGLDDFTVVSPRFDSDFHVEIDSKETGHEERDGSFEEAIMVPGKDTEHYSFDDSAYYKYWGGDYSMVEVTNNRNADGKRAVIFKDSYGIPVTAFLTNMFSNITIIDIRYYEGERSVKSIIENVDPDVVLYIYGPGYLGKKKMFTLK